MSKRKMKNNMQVIIKVETIKDFFRRGKRLARLLDQKKPITPKTIISFEHISDFENYLAHLPKK